MARHEFIEYNSSTYGVEDRDPGHVMFSTIAQAFYGSDLFSAPPSIHESYVEAAAAVPTSTVVGGWNVPLCPDREQTARYLPVVESYGARLGREMQEMGFHDEAQKCATQWMFRRYLDRVDINNRSYHERRWNELDAPLLPIEQKAKSGGANPAQLMLIGYGSGAPNVELARVSAPDIRPGDRGDKRRAIRQSIEALGGEHVNESSKISLEQYEHIGDNTLVRVHEKQILAVMRDNTQVARRIARVAQVAGRLEEKEILGDIIPILRSNDPDLPIVTQSELDYAYNRTGYVPDVYSGNL
jgi:hypothetical protein